MSKLNISERQCGDVIIFDLRGDILFEDGNIALRSALRRVLSESRNKILLNFSGVNLVDSAGIGELVSGFTAVNRADGQLKLVNLNQKIYYLLEITKLLIIFDVFDNESEALNGYG